MTTIHLERFRYPQKKPVPITNHTEMYDSGPHSQGSEEVVGRTREVCGGAAGAEGGGELPKIRELEQSWKVA